MDTFARAPLEFETKIVNSMSPPHSAEYVPAQHALAKDRETLRLIDQDMDACRLRLAYAYAQLCLLERQRDVVQHRVAIHRARLSPLRAVPDEVLQEIFWRCLPDTSYIVPDARSAPLVLTHVCRRWRVVAQGTSELWSSIALYDRGAWNYELEMMMVTQWLERCRARPIRMSIACAPYTDVWLDGNVSSSDMFQLAIAHSAQLSDLCLSVNKNYFRQFMVHARLPALRSLVMSLHSASHSDNPVELNTPTVFSAPNLRRVACYGNEASVDLVPRALYPNITHLALDCPMTLDLAHLFQDFVHLVHLSLSLSLSHDTLRIQLPLSQHDHAKTVVLGASLQHLDITLNRDMLDFGNPEELEAVLDPLALPALHTLSIAAPFGVMEWDDACTGSEAGWDKLALVSFVAFDKDPNQERVFIRPVKLPPDLHIVSPAGPLQRALATPSETSDADSERYIEPREDKSLRHRLIAYDQVPFVTGYAFADLMATHSIHPVRSNLARKVKCKTSLHGKGFRSLCERLEYDPANALRGHWTCVFDIVILNHRNDDLSLYFAAPFREPTLGYPCPSSHAFPPNRQPLVIACDRTFNAQGQPSPAPQSTWTHRIAYGDGLRSITPPHDPLPPFTIDDVRTTLGFGQPLLPPLAMVINAYYKLNQFMRDHGAVASLRVGHFADRISDLVTAIFYAPPGCPQVIVQTQSAEASQRADLAAAATKQQEQVDPQASSPPCGLVADNPVEPPEVVREDGATGSQLRLASAKAKDPSLDPEERVDAAMMMLFGTRHMPSLSSPRRHWGRDCQLVPGQVSTGRARRRWRMQPSQPVHFPPTPDRLPETSSDVDVGIQSHEL